MKKYFALLLCCALPAMAQQNGAGYDSAFTGYKAYQEPKVADWKLTNAAVTPTTATAADPHAGHDMSKMNHGAAADPHAGHVMPAAKPKAAPAHKAPPRKPSTPDPHAGHHNH